MQEAKANFSLKLSSAMSTAKAYTDRHYVSSFSGLPDVIRSGKLQGKSAKAIQVEMEAVDTWNLFRPARRRYARRKIRVFFEDWIWSMDLMEVPKLAPFNKNFRYVLVTVDNFSKMLRIGFMKTKSSAALTSAFSTILAEAKKAPVYLTGDQAGETLSKEFQRLLKENGIQFYWVRTKIKAAMAERMIRFLRFSLARRQYYYNTKDFLTLLPEIVAQYNARPHSVTLVAPSQASKDGNAEIIWKNLYEKLARKKPKQPKYKPGDYIKLSAKKSLFSKESVMNYGKEYFIIKKAIASWPTPFYYITDVNSNDIVGSVVEAEMIHVKPPPPPPRQLRQRSNNKKPIKVTVKKIIAPVVRKSARGRVPNKKYE